MWRIKNSQLAKQGITAVLLFGTAFGAGAQQMQQMHLPPAVAPTVISPKAQPPQPKPTLDNLKPPVPANSPNSARGMAMLGPAMLCARDNTPRIISINGRHSGIVFQPGASLNIDGCGFVGSAAGAQVSLSVIFGKYQAVMKGGEKVPLIIDAWSENNIRAHIDAALSGVPDFSNVRVNIQPSGASVIELSGGNSFRAAREQVKVAPSLPPGSASGSGLASIYANYYGDTKPAQVEYFGDHIAVRRSLTLKGACPEVVNQNMQMLDMFPIDFLANGFEVVGANYENLGNHSQGNHLGKNDPLQDVETLVGNEGGASYKPLRKSLDVIFQGHSTYWPRVGDPRGPESQCTSYYTVSLNVTGPRGLKPIK